MKIHIRDLKYDTKSHSTVLVCYAERIDENGQLAVVDGLHVKQMLKVNLFANCDWSILYVFMGVILLLLLLIVILWGLSLLSCQKKRKPKKLRQRPKLQNYSLIGTHDEEALHRRTTSLTDSETDSDVMFEARTKSTSILRTNDLTKRHSYASLKYNHTKLSRKIKA